jgi:hypothetical protein
MEGQKLIQETVDNWKKYELVLEGWIEMTVEGSGLLVAYSLHLSDVNT